MWKSGKLETKERRLARKSKIKRKEKEAEAG